LLQRNCGATRCHTHNPRRTPFSCIYLLIKTANTWLNTSKWVSFLPGGGELNSMKSFNFLAIPSQSFRGGAESKNDPISASNGVSDTEPFLESIQIHCDKREITIVEFRELDIKWQCQPAKPKTWRKKKL